MQTILYSISETDFRNLVSDVVKKALSEQTPKPQSKESTPKILTRRETAGILGVTLPTLHDYTKKGVVKGYRIGGRVRFYESDVLNALKEIRSIKYRRA